MDSDLHIDDDTRDEIFSCLYESLMQNWNIPKSVQDLLGITQDYCLFHYLEEMDPLDYRQKRSSGDVPDVLEVDARLTRTVETIFESICDRPPVPYLNKLNEELELLAWIVSRPAVVDNIFYVSDSFLAKYGLNKSDSLEDRSVKAEKGYRELDSRFVKMTGRRPYADDLFKSIHKTRSEFRKRSSMSNTPDPRGLNLKVK